MRAMRFAECLRTRCDEQGEQRGRPMIASSSVSSLLGGFVSHGWLSSLQAWLRGLHRFATFSSESVHALAEFVDGTR